MSDKIAYSMATKLLQPYRKKVLEFGCFRGLNAYSLVNSGANFVLGVDSVLESVTTAKYRYRHIPNLMFDLVLENNDIKLPEGITGFDCASMFFVHPTIPTFDILQQAIRKVSKVLASKGKVVMLGLHRNSFNEKYNFYCYAHNKNNPNLIYKDAQPFTNLLRVSPSEGSAFIKFTDHCWTTDTLCTMLKEEGFSKTEIIDFNLYDNLSAADRHFFRMRIKLMCEEYPEIKFDDELEAPLYQAIIGTKK